MRARTKTIFLDCPNNLDATSLYRGIGPFSHLAKTIDEDYNWIMTNEGHWPLYSWVDILFLQRPHSEDHKIKARIAQRMGAKLWIDYDDNLIDVPDWNPVHKHYKDPMVKANIIWFVAAADVVTVSTQQLAEQLNPYRSQAGRPPCEVINNALNERVFTRPPKMPERARSIMWRGSRTHDLDVMEFAEPLIEVIKSDPQTTYHFIGEPPSLFTRMLPKENTLVTHGVDVIEFFDIIMAIAPALQIVPLHDCMFNRCKSNIAYLEGAFFGTAALVPDWPEWRKPGAITYKDKDDFKTKLLECLTTLDVSEKAKEAWEYASTCLTLEFVNKKRERILRNLLSS